MKNVEKCTFFDLRGAASLANAAHPVDDCFRGLLIVHEDRFELTRSGVSAFGDTFLEQTLSTKTGEKC